MFEGDLGDDDDDFSFIDEDFLKDALQPAKSQHHIAKSKEVQSEVKAKPIVNDVSLGTHKTDSSKKLSERKDNVVGSAKSSSVNIKPDIKGNRDSQKTAIDIDFENDDFFDIFGSDVDFDSGGIQSTPLDSEFVNISRDKHINHEEHSVQKEDVIPQGNSDFRSRILQTLQVNKDVGKSSSSGNLSNNSSARSASLVSLSVANVEKRKRADCEDINVENLGIVTKRKSFPPVNQPQDIRAEQEFHNGSSFITPSKPAAVRKSVSPGGPIIQKRKFPGPAGILPQLGSRTTPLTVHQLDEEEQTPSVSKEIVCSQTSVEEFIRGPWRQMTNDLEHSQQHPSPLDFINIKWVQRRASLRGQACVRKIPFLAVMVRSIDATLLDATVVLKDLTGEMNGTIANSVLEEYNHVLHPGCVLLLKDVTLLSPVSLKSATGGREPPRRHYLNITLNTIITIYSSDESGQIITTTICEVDRKELFKRAASLKTTPAPRAIVEEEEEEMQCKTAEPKQQLFSNMPNCGSPTLHSNQIQQSFVSPRPGFNIPNQQQQRFRHNSPMSNSPRTPIHPGNNSSRFGSPRFGTVNNQVNFSPRIRVPNQLPRPGSPSANGLKTVPRFNFSSVRSPTASVSQGSVRMSVPMTQSRNHVNNGSSGTKNSIADKSIFHSQQEEKEFSDLLKDIDTDSFFGDF